jgi:Na+/H+ antiporter NhaA
MKHWIEKWQKKFEQRLKVKVSLVIKRFIILKKLQTEIDDFILFHILIFYFTIEKQLEKNLK